MRIVNRKKILFLLLIFALPASIRAQEDWLGDLCKKDIPEFIAVIIFIFTDYKRKTK